MFSFPGFRLRLRPIRMDDLDAIMGWINDPEVTRNFAGMSTEITREQEAAFLEAQLASPTDRLFAIETLDGRYVGNAGVHKIYWPARNGRLGVVIGAKGAHGQGYGTEAIRLVTALAFAELRLHKLWAVHFHDNERMKHILGKLGFVEEGVLRDEYFHRDRFHDMLRHSMLEQEFARLRPEWGIP